MSSALYPGTFDPAHFGHIDIVRRAAVLFEHVIVGVYDLPAKSLLFSTEERVAMLRIATQGLRNVSVAPYRGLTVEFADVVEASVIIRGLRMFFDFELEYQMALTNRKLAPHVDTVCLMTSLEYAFVSSSIVKEISMAGGCVDQMAPPHVVATLRGKLDDLGDGSLPKTEVV